MDSSVGRVSPILSTILERSLDLLSPVWSKELASATSDAITGRMSKLIRLTRMLTAEDGTAPWLLLL